MVIWRYCNMVKDFSYYLEKGDVKKSEQNPSEAKSLFEKAERRLERCNKDKLNSRNADLLFEDIYEAIRESAQSLMSLKGYKPYSHEATVAFIKEFYSEFTDYEVSTFDRFRRLRNDSVYKAVVIDMQDTNEIIGFAVAFIKKIKMIIYSRK